MTMGPQAAAISAVSAAQAMKLEPSVMGDLQYRGGVGCTKLVPRHRRHGSQFAIDEARAGRFTVETARGSTGRRSSPDATRKVMPIKNDRTTFGSRSVCRLRKKRMNTSCTWSSTSHHSPSERRSMPRTNPA